MNIPKYLKLTVIGLAVIAGTAACSSAPAPTAVPAKPTTFTMTGMLTMSSPKTVQNNCTGVGGYDDIAPGAAITVTDDKGAIVAVGRLGRGLVHNYNCEYEFEVPAVPGFRDFYGVEVTHRGIVTYPESQARVDVQLTLG